MPLPAHTQIRLPLLEVLEKLGGQAEPQKVYPKVAEYFPQLTSEDLTATLPNYPNTRRWWNRVQWVRQSLKKEGYIDSPKDGVWRITPEGAAWLHQQLATEAAEAAEPTPPADQLNDTPVSEAKPPTKTGNSLAVGVRILQKFGFFRLDLRTSKAKSLARRFQAYEFGFPFHARIPTAGAPEPNRRLAQSAPRHGQ